MTEQHIKVLIVEDEEVDLMAIERFIKQEALRYDYICAMSLAKAKDVLRDNTFDVIIADYILGDGNAIELLELGIKTPIIISTKSGSEEAAVRAMKLGAYDYIIKDIDREYLKIIPLAVNKALQRRKIEDHVRMLTAAISQITDSVIILDKDGKIIYINNAFSRTYGYDLHGIQGAAFSELEGVAPPAQEAAEGPILAHISGIVAYHKRRSGDIFPVSLSRSSLALDGDSSYSEVIVARDITDQLKAQERHLMAMFSQWNPAPLIRVDDNLKIVIANKSARENLGIADPAGIDLQDVLPDIDRFEVTRAIKKGALFNRNVSLGEKTFNFIIRGVPELNVAQIYGFETTELTALHKELMEKERLAIIGKTVSGIAHCMKNIFTVLRGGLNMLKRAAETSDRDMADKAAVILERAINHLYLVLMNMLDYSKERTADREMISIEELFDEVVELTPQSPKHQNVTILKKIHENAASFDFDFQLICRSLLNLTCNALDAIHETGSVTLSAYRTSRDEWNTAHNDHTLGAEWTPDLFILEVADTGGGIAPEDIEQIFAPFYSSKGSRGTGLGLATVKQFAEAHDGKVFVTSQLLVGTTFHLVFPANAAN